MYTQYACSMHLSVLCGANARAGEAFALRKTPLWTLEPRFIDVASMSV